jgi:hypothetical protein
MALVGVGTTAPGVTIALHGVEDALKAQGARRGRDFVIGIGLQDQGLITGEEARTSALGLHRGKLLQWTRTRKGITMIRKE